MPVYDLYCDQCGDEVLDVPILLKDLDEPVNCPSCGNHMTRKCGNAGGFKLKGDGWGQDGYDKLLGDINITRRRDGKPEVGYEDIHGRIE